MPSRVLLAEVGVDVLTRKGEHPRDKQCAGRVADFDGSS